MDYQAQIGQKVLREDGVLGILSEVNEQGFFKIDFEDHLYDGYIMFDPFLEGRFFFLDPFLQIKIDKEIASILKKREDLIKPLIATSIEEENYYVTLANEDGTLEKVFSLNCDRDQAFIAFRYVVHKQGIEYHKPGANKEWRQVRLWDVKAGRYIAQES